MNSDSKTPWDAQSEGLQQPPTPGDVIGVPRLSRATLSRPRLLRALESDAQLPLRVVQAPAGYGKTSLLAEWVRGRPARDGYVVWVTIDETCNKRVDFWRRVVELLDTKLPARAGAERLDVTSDLAAILPSILLREFESLQRPVTLVVDAYENIVDPAVETDLLRLVEHTSNLSLAIGTRAPTTFTSISTGLRVDAILLSTHDLAFTAEECTRLAAHVGSPMSAEQLRALHEASAGWPLAVRAGVQTAQENPWPSGYEADTLSRVQRMLLSDLEQLPGFDDLVLLSVVDGFTVEQAELMGADLTGSSLLAEVESRGLGTWEEGAGSPRFRIHLLVRQALRAQLDEVRLGAVHRRLISWYEDQGDYGHAFESSLVAEEWHHARDLLASHFWEVAASIERYWFRRVEVPKHVLRSQPLLAIFVGLTYYGSGDVGKAVRILTASIANVEWKRLTDRRRFSVDHFWAQGMLTLGLRFAGRDDLVQPALRRLRTMLDQVDDPSGELRHNREMIGNQMASTYLLLDRIDDATQTLVLSPLRQVTGTHNYYSRSLAILAHAAAGQIDQARKVQTEFVDASKPRFFGMGFYAVPEHLGAALVHLEDNRPDAAEQKLEQIRPHLPKLEMWPLVLQVQALQQWQAAGPIAALRTLEAGRAEKKGKPLGAAMRAALTALHAELLLAAGRPAEAAVLVPSRAVRPYPRLLVAKARCLLMQGEPSKALDMTGRPEHEHRTTLRDRVHLRLIAASARLRIDDRAGASRSFEEAVELAVRSSLRSPFACMPRQDFAELAASVPGIDDLRDHIERFPQMFPEPLTIVSLTRRELAVLSELTSSDPLPVIARRLSVSTHTVKSQCRAMYRKLGVSGREQAVAEARLRGIL